MIKNMKLVEACLFSGLFERRDLEFIVKWCQTIINITEKKLKTAPAKTEQATNTQLPQGKTAKATEGSEDAASPC